MTIRVKLFAMLKEHLERVIQGIDEAISGAGTPRDQLLAFVEAYTQKSAQSRRRHMVAMNDVKYLPRARQAPLVALQRQVTDRLDMLAGGDAEADRQRDVRLHAHSFEERGQLVGQLRARSGDAGDRDGRQDGVHGGSSQDGVSGHVGRRSCDLRRGGWREGSRGVADSRPTGRCRRKRHEPRPPE